MEHGGRVWVASDDYKLEADGTCAPFEPVRCDTFITESTLGLPIYRWPAQAELWSQINDWWRANAAMRRPSMLFCHAFGKAQRILHGIDASIGPLLMHGAVEPLKAAYRAAGLRLPPTRAATNAALDAATRETALVLAPPSAPGYPLDTPLSTPRHADAFASGWMQLRGTRRRRGVDRGSVLSDQCRLAGPTAGDCRDRG